MNKRRKIFQRAVALLCCILLLPSLAAVPVLAASDDEVFFDVLEFCTANDSGSQVVSGSLPMSVIYRTVQEPFRYIDMVVITDIPDLYITYAGNYLTTVLIGTNYGYTYRVYGDLVGDPSGYLAFTVGGSSGSWISFESMRVSSFTSSQETYPTLGGLYVYPSGSNSIVYMPDPDTEVKSILYWNNNWNTYSDFRGEVYLSDWKKYDYIDVYMEYYTAGINSIGVSINDVAIPHTVTYLDSSFDHNSSIVEGSEFATSIRQRVMISIDLREVNRTNGYMPLIFFTGRYEGWSVQPSITLRSVTGYVVAEASSPLGTFWKNLVSTLNQLFGKNDPAAEAAKQEQADIDYDVNLEIVGAMENWESNITVVQTGYDDSLSRAAPALVWLSTLADNVFNKMGWFGNIYLMLGLFSLFLFILSKSGLPHSIGRISRRD